MFQSPNSWAFFFNFSVICGVDFHLFVGSGLSCSRYILSAGRQYCSTKSLHFWIASNPLGEILSRKIAGISSLTDMVRLMLGQTLPLIYRRSYLGCELHSAVRGSVRKGKGPAVWGLWDDVSGSRTTTPLSKLRVNLILW